MNIDKYAKLNNEVDSLIAETNTKMHDLIEKYNESIEDDEDASEVDTVDLNRLFRLKNSPKKNPVFLLRNQASFYLMIVIAFID